MRSSFLGVVRAWWRQHPGQAVGALVVLAVLLGGLGYWAWGYVTARSHYRAAQRALDRHEWSEALTHLEACLRTRPNRPDAHLLAARAARHLDLLHDAEGHLDTCQRLQGSETQAVKVERALLRVHRGDLAAVEGFLRDCVAQDDADAEEILDILAAALVLDRRVPEAHRCLDDLLRRQPDNFNLLVRRAATAVNQSWHTVAVESLQKAVDLRPEAPDVRLSLAQNLLMVGRYAEALEHLTWLRQREPENPAVVFALARCLAWQGQKEQAALLLDRLLAQEPTNWAVLSERGWLCLELDRPAEAEGYLRRAHSLAPPNQALLTQLADCLRLLGKHDEARPYREEAERLRVETLRAVDLAKRIREERPIDPALCHELAGLYLRLGQEQTALHYYQKALEQNPRHRPTHEALAAFYARVGAYGQAAYHRRQLGANP
jgi:predicted Zn-dependent protease